MKNKNIIWVILIIAAIVLIYLFANGTFGNQIPLSQEANPANLGNTNSSGTGIAVTMYNCPPDIANMSIIPQNLLSQCTKISIPTKFSSAGESIVTRTTPITCTSTATCLASYSTTAALSPNLECYNSQCVLGSITAIQLGIGVLNPASSTLTFTGVSPTSVTSTLAGVWSTAMSTMASQTLTPGQSYSWTGAAMGTSQFVGTTQTFATTISGTNGYTGSVTQATSSVSLVFATDPSGSLTASISSPI